MSNALAIAATTATMRSLLIRGVSGLPNQNVTTKPLDKARAASDTGDQINIFLYQTVLNAAWRNTDMPRRLKPGESGFPPLALNLHYLVTAFGQGDDDARSHQWLGRAMGVLHDHPVLGAQEIKDALLDNDLHEQIERVRITPQPLTLEEMSKLWTAFQTQYRISAAYQVEVVLIESTRSASTPLPVLTRGKDDRGVTAQADLIPPFPTITDVRLVDPATGEQHSMQRRLSFDMNDQIAILGHHFYGTDGGDPASVDVTVRFSSPRLTAPHDTVVVAGDRTDQLIRARIPNDPANFPAGFYLLSVRIGPNGKPEEVRATNEWPVLVAPKITSAMPMTVARTNVGEATINLDCSPAVRPEQAVTLALGDKQVAAEAHPAQTIALSFVAKQIAAGDYRVRLRVDGVDSHLIDFTDPKQPRFIDALTVKVT